MLKPDLPNNESHRLRALESLRILDTKAEERFDRITRIAKKLFNVPIALVSLVDANRQWFKSTQGLAAQETERDISFCGHVILTDDIMIVEDASLDYRFSDNPLVLGDPNIKFYLGCPLKIKNQYNVGTLCLIDRKARKFGPEDIQVIRDLADMVQAELESFHISTTDELTTLTNRRGFLMIGSHVFDLCKRNNQCLGLLFFDLNKFKLINDTLGHAEGDKVLHTFARILLDAFRSSDVIARLGGDEFCVLGSDFRQDSICPLLERLDQALKIETEQLGIQYSVGFIKYEPNKHQSINDLLKEADHKMYQNKRQD